MQGISRSAPGVWQTIEYCRWLNHYLGTTIEPWELDERVPEVWLEAISRTVGLSGEMAEKGLTDGGS